MDEQQQPVDQEHGAQYDAVVVGAGAAGLSGALALGRARRRVLVVDSGEPRNARAEQVHNYLTSEGVPPAELLAAGRAEAKRYGVEVLRCVVRRADRVADDSAGDGGAPIAFTVKLANGRTVRARRLLIATGLTDQLPDIPGVAELWGRGVLHCPYCHGWEARDRAIGIIGTGPLAVHGALLWRQWTDDVVLFQHTAPALTAEQAEQLAARGIRVVEGEVTALERDPDGALTGVRTSSGELIARDAAVVAPGFTARADLLATLGVKTADFEMGGSVLGDYVPADAFGATEAPGVWVAGNVNDPMAQVIVSAAAGLKAGAAINADLVAEDTAAAVARYRAARSR